MNSFIISLHDLLGTFRSRLEAPGGLEPDALTAILALDRAAQDIQATEPGRPVDRAGLDTDVWCGLRDLAAPSPFSATPGSSARGRNHGPARPIGEQAAVSRSSNKRRAGLRPGTGRSADGRAGDGDICLPPYGAAVIRAGAPRVMFTKWQWGRGCQKIGVRR